MARDISVRLSADVAAYISSIGQAEQATARLADAADRLSSIRVEADTSAATSGLDSAAASADDAAASMEGAAGAAETAGGGMESAGASAQDAAAGMDSASASAQDAGGGLESAGASAETASAGLESAGASAQDAAAGLESAGASGESVAASVGQVSAASQTVAADMLSVSAAAQTAGGSLSSAGGSAQSVSADMMSASGAASSLGGSLDGLGASFASGLSFSEGMSGSMLGLIDRTSQARGHLSDYGQTMRSIAGDSRAFGAGLAVIGGGITAMLGSVIQTGIAYNTLQQVAGRALETMTGSAEAAAVQMERLHAFADESPFARDTWISAQQQLMAFGMEAERVVPTLEGVQNAVAAIGGGDAEIMQLVDILGQVEGQGRITGRELQRLGQMGINAADLIGESMGVSGNEIRAQITAGALDAETAITALTDGMMNRFGGAAEGLRDTMEGALDRIRARIRDIGSVIAAPLVDPSGGGFLVEAINQAADFGNALLDLPDPVLQAGAAITGTAGLVMAAGGAWALAGGQIAAFATGAWNTVTATVDLARNLVDAAGGFRRVASAAGPAVAALAGLAVIGHVSTDSEEAAASIERMTQELSKARRGADAFTGIDWTQSYVGADAITDLGSAMEFVADSRWHDGLSRFADSTFGLSSEITDLEANFENLDSAMSSAFESGDFENAASGMQEFAAAGAEAGLSAEEITGILPGYTDQLRSLAEEAGQTATAEQILAVATSEAGLAALDAGEDWRTVTDAMESGRYEAQLSGDAAMTMSEAFSRVAEASGSAAEGIKSLVSEMNAYSSIGSDARTSTYDWLDLLDEAGEVLAAGSVSLDQNTAAGRENLRMLDDIAGSTMEAATSNAVLGGSFDDVAGDIRTGIGTVEDFARAAGMSAEETEALVRELYGIPDEVPIDLWVEDRATDIVTGVDAQLAELGDQYTIWLEAQDEGVRQVIAALRDGDTEVLVDLLADDEQARAVVSAFERGDYQAIADLIAEDGPARTVVYDFTTGQYVARVDLEGNDSPVREVIAAILNRDFETVMAIAGDDEQLQAEVEYLTGADWDDLILSMDADTEPALETLDDFHEQVQSQDSMLLDVGADTEPAEESIEETTSTDWLTEILGVALVGTATASLNDTARDRESNITGVASTGRAEVALTELIRARIAPVTASASVAVASGALNAVAAARRIATITASAVTGVASGALNAVANAPRTARIGAQAITSQASGALNAVARASRVARITATASTGGALAALRSVVNRRWTATIRATVSGLGGVMARIGRAVGGNAAGGRAGGLPSYSTGGRLPSTGLGTDQIMGISRSGRPTAMVDDREWIINQQSSDKYDRALAMINANHPAIHHLASYADGGRARSFESSASRGGPSFDMDRLADSLRDARPLIGSISAEGGDTTQVVNRVGDVVFRRLREEGVPVGSF